jgi:iron complex outermembrane receptor protein
MKKPNTRARFSSFLGGACTIALLMGLSGTNSFAQSSDVDQGEDVVVATGTLIRSRTKDFETPSPVQTLDEDVFKNTGTGKIQDVFKGLTVNSGSQLGNRQNALQGVSQFSLRGLGIGSTLTLVNGRRAGLAPITDSSGGLFTDSNQFPTNMIKKVEVLTDGASSTYGSEAVAGVVNIFTRDDFEGFELTSEFRTATNEAFQLGAGFGAGNDRGHITAFANYYTQSGNFRTPFDVVTEDNTFEDGVSGAFDSSTGSPGRFNLAQNNGDGTFSRTGNTLADPDCLAAGGLLDGQNCRYYFINQRRLIAEEERFQVFSQANYDLTDKINVFAEAGFSRNEIIDGAGGLLTRVTTQDGGFLVPGDHPFNFFVSDGAGGISYAGPEAFAADPNLQAVDLIYRGRILGRDGDGGGAEFGGRDAEDINTVFTNTRLLGGFDYSLNDNWLLNASYMFSKSDFSRVQPRDWDIDEFQAQIIAGNWNPFGTRLVNPGLISPKDPDAIAANSDEIYNRINLLRSDRAEVTQQVAEAILSGQTGIELGGGEIALAVGGQYRLLDLADIPDGRYQSGNNRLNQTVPAVFGDQSAYAIFGEVVFPLTEALEIQTALRYEDYGSDGGDTIDPKVAVKFDLNDNVTLRGSWGTSFQAPSIRQISGVISNAAIVDPADPGAGNFNITVTTLGSDDLTPQSAENLNLGVIFRTDFGLDLTADYWTYDYEGLILPGADPQFIFDQVFAGNLPADRASREASGQPASVIANFVNGGSAQTSGIDLVGRYRFEGLGGDMTLDASTTIITEFDSSEFGDIKGTRNFTNGFGSAPDFKWNAGVTYERGNHTANITGRFIGSYLDDQNDADVDSQFTLDARYSVVFDQLFGGEGTTLNVGLVNVLDQDPPRLQSRPFYDEEVHDLRGRQFYVGIKQNF